MAEFEDALGQRWPVTINVGIVREIKQETGHDLMQFLDGALFEKLALNPLALCDILEIATAAREHGTVDELANGLAGDAIVRAYDALVSAIVDFFHPSLRQPLTAAVERFQSEMDRRSELAANRIRTMNLDPLPA